MDADTWVGVRRAEWKEANNNGRVDEAVIRVSEDRSEYRRKGQWGGKD